MTQYEVAEALRIDHFLESTVEYYAIRKLWRDHRRLRLIYEGKLERGRPAREAKQRVKS